MFVLRLQPKPREYCISCTLVFMQFVQFLFWFLCFFVKFTNLSHCVHILFIIDWYTLDTVKEEIRLPDNKAYKINFFIIAQAPKGVWALLILWEFTKKSLPNRKALLDVHTFCLFSSSCFLLIAKISSFRDSIRASRSDTIRAHSTSSFLMFSGASPSNL